MNAARAKAPARLGVLLAAAAASAVLLAGCSGGMSPADRAQTEVAAKEKAVSSAQAEFDAASQAFCSASKTYIQALDRYGDVLHATAPTVGDVRTAGKDLTDPKDEAFAGADAAVAAQQRLVTAQQELADAQAALAAAQSSGSPSPASPQPTATSLASPTAVDRVKQAESDFADAQAGITDQTSLKDASEQFNSAVVAVEMAWLALYSDAGCLVDQQKQKAAEAVIAYATALQKDLATAGYYAGDIDGVYGPETVAAVESLQKAAGLPVTGAVDKATSAALQKKVAATGGAAAQDSVASTAAVQQTLKLTGFWNGPVDGVWTPELTDAVIAFQTALGVPATGAVDAATVSAFEKAIAQQGQATPAPTPTASPTPSATP
ncbi:peptidoglycan-binding protein [Microbacterium mangrovi]|uniref:Peptidoglycan-binding protein n=1 Tax=Microbacterium mangrovi TaxID=1348253 RepID=A0A0B2ADZ5_9MICO|nr:peptidoglycan-binding domain-containing protein [Microbacterium mangrovi]KHK99940.1 peptidoglycan-binding protein [Microbacterium mangrovi]